MGILHIGLLLLSLTGCWGVPVVEVEEDRPVDLSCLSAQAATYTEVRWYHKVTGGPDRLLQTVSVGRDPTLSLTRRASLEDAGEYRCDVLDPDGGVLATSSVRLKVYVEPELILRMDPMPYVNNQSVNVSCTIPRVYPAIDDQLFNLTFITNSHEVVYETKSNRSGKAFILAIEHHFLMSPEFSNDTLMCQASTGRATYTEEVNIHVLEELTETREVFEGERVQLTCPPSGGLTTRWGKVTTTGHKEEWPVGRDVVDVVEADEDDQGTYTCTQTVRGVDVNVLTVQLYVLRGRLRMAPGPYTAGQVLEVVCEVVCEVETRPSGNLRLLIGDLPIPEVTEVNTPSSLMVNGQLEVTSDLDGQRLVCLYLRTTGPPRVVSDLVITVNRQPVSTRALLSGIVPVVLLTLLSFGVFSIWKRKRKKRNRETEETSEQNDYLSIIDESEENVALTTGEGLLPAVEGVDNGGRTPERRDPPAGGVMEREHVEPYMTTTFTDEEGTATYDDTTSPSASDRVAASGSTSGVDDSESGYLKETKRTPDGGILGNTALQGSQKSEYEKLRWKRDEPSDLDHWLDTHQVAGATCRRLRAELIRRPKDLALMTEQDVLRLDLPLGEELRLRAAITKLREEADIKETEI